MVFVFSSYNQISKKRVREYYINLLIIGGYKRVEVTFVYNCEFEGRSFYQSQFSEFVLRKYWYSILTAVLDWNLFQVKYEVTSAL